MMKKIEGSLSISKARVAIVASRFNEFIVRELERGAIDGLKRSGLAESAITLVHVPGAFEIPLVAKQLATSNHYDGIIALGAVIRGSTPHFDYVAGECVKGLNQVAFQTDVPVAFGVLTVDSIEQAIERAGTKAGNKGEEAARTLIEMISLLKQLSNAAEK